MTEKKTNETKASYVPTENDVVYPDGRVRIGANKKVNISIDKEAGVKDQIPVYINNNGETMLVDRGKTVPVKASTAEIVHEAERLSGVSNDYYAKASE